jgi:hypothetical protein
MRGSSPSLDLEIINEMNDKMQHAKQTLIECKSPMNYLKLQTNWNKKTIKLKVCTWKIEWSPEILETLIFYLDGTHSPKVVNHSTSSFLEF